jgi:RNA polymerase-binding transcription factor DksA
MPTKKKKVSAKKATPRKAKPAHKVSAKKSKVTRERATASPREAMLGNNHRERKLNPFTRKQKEKLLQLRDAMVDSMAGVAQDTLRSRAEGSEASAFGMHQADAGSDAYDRDFALSLLSQEQDALYEIDQALKRIELGTYGVCEMSGKPIPHARLEAIPFARFTVECQSQLEKQNKMSRVRQSVTSLFGLTDDEDKEGEGEEEATPAAETKE